MVRPSPAPRERGDRSHWRPVGEGWSAGASYSNSRPRPERRSALLSRRHRPQRGLVGGDDRLSEFALPAGDRGHRRKIAARHDKGLDLRAVDAGEGVAGVFRPELADRIGIGRGKAFERDHRQSVLALEITLCAGIDRLGIGRDEGDPLGAERAHCLADRHRRSKGRNPSGGADAPAHLGAIIIGKKAGRGLQQENHFDPGGAEELRLIVDILVARRRERCLVGAARRHAGVMRLPFGRQEAAVFDLGRRVGRRDQDAEMADRGGHRRGLSRNGGHFRTSRRARRQSHRGSRRADGAGSSRWYGG